MAISIPYPKTWVSGEVLTAADLNAQFNAVTGLTGIDGGQIGTGTITGTQIASSTITSTQLANGATFIQTTNGTGSIVTVGTSDTVIATSAITLARTHVRIFASIGGGAAYSTTGTNTFTLKIKEDGSTIYTGPPVTLTIGVGQTGPIFIAGATIRTTTAAAHSYTVTVIKQSSDMALVVDGYILIEEIA